MSEKIKILNEKQIAQKIDRIAYQIWEDNFDEKEIVFAGLAPGGILLAKRLVQVMEKQMPLKIILASVIPSKNNDFLGCEIDIDIDQCKNKAIILIDDVLNTGRALAYSLGVFLNIPTKRIRTLALVDRSDKCYPIHTDYVGIELSTLAQEHIHVVLNKEEEDAVYIQ